jgi:hypothetical protein
MTMFRGRGWRGCHGSIHADGHERFGAGMRDLEAELRDRWRARQQRGWEGRGQDSEHGYGRDGTEATRLGRENDMARMPRSSIRGVGRHLAADRQRYADQQRNRALAQQRRQRGGPSAPLARQRPEVLPPADGLDEGEG